MTEHPNPPRGAADESHSTTEGSSGATEDSRGTTEDSRGTTAGSRGAAEGLRELRRSRDERMLAGVLGGLAQRLGIDPVLLRIVTVVLAVFGGVGIVLYAAGWLLIPDEGTDRSVAEQALGRSDDRAEPATLWLAGGLVLAVLFAAGATFGSGVGTVLLVLAATGVIVLLRRDGDSPATRFADRAPGESPAGPAPDGASPQAADRIPAGGDGTPGDTSSEHLTTEHEPHGSGPSVEGAPAGPESSEADADARPEYVHSFTAPVGPASDWPEPPDWPAADFDPAGFDPAGFDPYSVDAAQLPDEKPPNSHLGALTLSAVAVALGVLAINDATYAVVPASAYVALALAIIGAGLLIGAWFGRARGLIAWGLFVMFIALPIAAIGDFLDWDLSGEDRTITIDDAAELPAEPRSHGMGRVVYDLGDMELVDADRLALDVSQNVGSLQIIVPPEVDVTVNASTGMGHIMAFDEQAGGHQDITVTDVGPDGAGGGELTLDLALELGEIIVERAHAPAGDVNGQGVPR